MEPKLMLSPNFGYKNANGATGGRGVKGRHGYKVGAIAFHVLGSESTQATQTYLMRPGTPASYNDLILKSGEWIILVDHGDPAWSNGAVNKPTWNGLKKMASGAYINPNLYTHSICREGHNHHKPTEKQWQALIYVAKLRAQQHNLPLTRTSFIGHNDIDSVNRWYCPGSGFDWHEFMQDVGAAPKRQEYVIIRGDTFHGIARRFSLSVPELAGANPEIKNPSLIFPGQVIHLPEKKF